MQWISKSLPEPRGPYQVGYHDLMTPGLPDDSTLMRVVYPAAEGASRPTTPPLWTDTSPKAACIDIIKAMAFGWPSWAPDSEYLLFPLVRTFLNKTTFPLVFSTGWTALGHRLTLPLIPGAPLHASPSSKGWPVVIFSHGMGCTRASMSQITYQLASQGVVVASVEHREGSACSSFYRRARGEKIVGIPHRTLEEAEDEIGEREAQARHRAREIVRVIHLLGQIQAGLPIDNVMSSSTSCSPSPLAGALDLSSLHLMGHSFGGSSILLVASMLGEDSKLRGILALDPWMFPVHRMNLRVNRPLCVINSEAFRIPENVKAVEEAVKESSQEVEWQVLKGGVHLSATDIPMIFPQVPIRKGMGFMASISPEEAMESLNRSSWKFISRQITRAKEDSSQENYSLE